MTVLFIRLKKLQAINGQQVVEIDHSKCTKSRLRSLWSRHFWHSSKISLDSLEAHSWKPSERERIEGYL